MMTAAIRVLYVDDEPALLDLARMFMEQSGDFTVTITTNAPEAIRILGQERYDAIVSDYQMPEMDGIEFLKQVRATDKSIPFIIFTGKGREEIAIEAFENGADGYIQKGGDAKSQFGELAHKIHATVDHRRADMQVIALNRLYTVLSATNKAIVRIHDKTELLNEICRIVVDIGGFAMAWAGFVNPEKHLIESVAAYGHIDGYLDTVALSPDDIPWGRDPSGTAFRERKFNVCNDIVSDPTMAPLREEALKRGYRSLAAFPFALDTNKAGVITFYASEPGFFTDQIIRLLDEQSGDLTFAFLTLDHEEQRGSTETDLKTSELQYRRLFETAQDAILILDGNTGEVIDANKFIIDMLGYPLEYFVGKHLWELGFIKDKSIAQHAFTELKTNGYIRYEDIPLETKDGQSMDVEFISNAYLVGDKKIFQCNIRDITARKRAEDALRQTNKQLNLLSSITRHDIKNQLMALKGYLELSEEVIDKPETLREFIKKEQQAANIIEHQITFTKIYQEMGNAAPAWQSVNATIHKAIAGLPMRDVRVEPDPTDPEVYTNPLFEKVFYNLIDNALRYGGDDMKTIRVLSQDLDTGLLIVCEDDGVGISAEDKKRLFTRGFGKNTGLGLFLSREILAITGITITENGTPGKGARFEITVPKGAFRFREADVAQETGAGAGHVTHPPGCV
jgi:PAS domain S-box-containing protein